MAVSKREVLGGWPDRPVALRSTLGGSYQYRLKGRNMILLIVLNNFCIDSTPVLKEKQDLDAKLQNLCDLDSLGVREQDKKYKKILWWFFLESRTEAFAL